MADIEYRDLFWQVRTELPGVPQPVLFYNYAEAVREFCRRSKAWQYDSPSALDLNASTDWPTITAGTHIPTSTYVIEPVRVKWSNGQFINFKTRDQLDRIDGDWEQATAAVPDYWTITSPGAFRIYPHLSANETSVLYMRFAIAPTVSLASPRTSMPEEIVNEWQHVWAHGALSKIMKIPGKDWTNIALAGDYGNLFDEGIADAKSRAAADYGRPHRSMAYGGLPMSGSGGVRESDDYGR